MTLVVYTPFVSITKVVVDTLAVGRASAYFADASNRITDIAGWASRKAGFPAGFVRLTDAVPAKFSFALRTAAVIIIRIAIVAFFADINNSVTANRRLNFATAIGVTNLSNRAL